jgi:photosystem II stability/assembly factor-like uncharacterized protein
MKKMIFTLTILTAIIFKVSPQWYLQESGTTANLRGVWFADSLNGWACGDSGIIVHTTNKGLEWSKQNSNVSTILMDIFFQNLQKGWAVGDFGTILFTSDGGNNWEIKESTVTTLLRKVKFADSSHGMIVGNQTTLVGTEDGGITWQSASGGFRDIYSLVYTQYWNWMFFVERWHGAKIATIFRTTNNGMTWDTTLTSPCMPLPNDVYAHVEPFIFYLYSAACKNGFMLTSTDEGNNWRIGGGLADTTIDFFGTTYDSVSLKLWGVGSKGKIVSSIDTGKTWAAIQSGVNVDLYDIIFPCEKLGWAVGDSGVILRYDNPTFVNNPSPEEFLLGFHLSNPYPNPFNPTTKIKFTIPSVETGYIPSLHITLKVYDVFGNDVSTLVCEEKQAGNYEVEFDGTGLPSGVYIYQLKVGGPEINSGQGVIQTKKMILIK